MVVEQFFVVLDRLRDMPEALIHIRSLRRLACFLDGWCYAHKDPSVNKRLFEFDRWIHNKIEGVKHSSNWWPDIIAFIHGDGAEGFDAFWKYYDEFNEELIKKQEEERHAQSP